MLTRETVISDIADALDQAPDALTDDMDLLDQGMDSIRVMGLVEKWREAGAAEVDYPTLAADPTVGRWVDVALGRN